MPSVMAATIQFIVCEAKVNTGIATLRSKDVGRHFGATGTYLYLKIESACQQCSPKQSILKLPPRFLQLFFTWLLGYYRCAQFSIWGKYSMKSQTRYSRDKICDRNHRLWLVRECFAY